MTLFEFKFNAVFEQHFAVQPGRITVMHLVQSAGATKLIIEDNEAELQQLPSLYGSLNGGETYEKLSTEFMQRLATSEHDMLLRIDCTQLTNGPYKIHTIKCDKPVGIEIIDGDLLEHFYYDASQRVYDEADLKKVVRDNLHELSKAAQDSAAWQCKYYPSRSLANINVLNANELRSIKDCIDVAVFFPHRKVIGQLDFDQFGLQYDELTTLHILADDYHRICKDDFARPAKFDIIYIPFLEQYFEVSDVVDIKTPINTILYYELTIKAVSDRQSVAKDEDILDISDMIDSLDKDAMLHNKNKQPMNEGKGEIIDFTEHTWSSQTFKRAQQYTLVETDNYIYCIARFENMWCKYKVIDNVLYMQYLSDSHWHQIYDKVKQLYVAKLAMFDKQLSEFDETMYYTTPIIPRTLQPLELIELQTRA